MSVHRTLSAPPGFWLVGGGSRQFLLARRPFLGALALALLVFIAFDVSLVLGSAGLNPVDSVLALFGIGETKTVFIVQKLRLFRAGAAVLTGSALGVAGCLLQTLARNRLATPDTTGITAGATAFAVWSVLSFSFGGATGLPQYGPPMMSLLGATIAAGLAFALSGGAGAQGFRLLWGGTAIVLLAVALARGSRDQSA